MTDPVYDVCGIGNAIVDVLAQSNDGQIADLGLAKGAMTLIDADQAENLYAAMGPGQEVSGGSAANTMAGIASLGSRAAYIGRIRDDQLGSIFGHDIRASGVAFESAAAAEGPSTARCLIFVTPDAQRTMATYLGACVHLGPDNIDETMIAASGITYMEGYLWDAEPAKEAFLKAAQVAHNAGRKVSLSLSDSFCIDRHRDSFRTLVEGHIDILFANEDEITSLYQVSRFEEALQAVKGQCALAALTRSEKGAVILAGDEVFEVPAEPVDRVVDTTGAGDLYAAGFLHGLAQGKDAATCGRYGAIAAAEVISHYGARPEQSLAGLIAE